MINKKIVFFGAVLFVLMGISFLVHREWNKIQPFSFGVIADCQYCADPGSGIRKYAASEQKLKRCVDHFNDMDLEYVVHLGDFIDRDIASFDVVSPIYKQLKISSYHVLGNHDFSVSDEYKSKVPEIMGLAERYYDFKKNGWRFIVLDGNDISFHAYPENSDDYKFAENYYEEHQIKSPRWNGAVGDRQLSWLENVLQSASSANEKVALYCHFPIFPENPHNLWNADEIIDLIDKYPVVKAYLNGHNHAGNYGYRKGVHYMTFKGMVDTEESSYATVQVLKDKLIISGFGREENKVLKLKK